MACGFGESAVSNFVGTLLVDCVAKPLGSQFYYLRKYGSNVENFRERKEELSMAKDRLLHEIEEAENQLLKIEYDVQGSLTKADDLLTAAKSLEQEIEKNKRCFGWCPNWWRRYRLSKKIAKKELDISEHLKKMDRFGQPRRVGCHPPSTIPTIEFRSSKNFMVSKASTEVLSHILEALKDDNVSMIGLRGMGGSGKTTLVREVEIQAKRLNLSYSVLFTTFSQKPNFDKLRDEITKFLHFHNTDKQERRSKLQTEKKILIVLDDVWANIALQEIGISLEEEHKGCKFLLTTRRLKVLNFMVCQMKVQLGCLEKEEARALFEMKAGLNENTDVDIKNPVGKIVEKCDGLPLAIVTLATALKGIADPFRWEIAYEKLRNCSLDDIEDIPEKNAYACLKLGFDYLNDTGDKDVFLVVLFISGGL